MTDKIARLERQIAKFEELLNQRVLIAHRVIEDITVEDIKRKMYSANYSIRIIDEVEVTDVRITQNKVEYTIFNELLVGDGFDIATGREEGIPAHTIRGNPTLAFPGKTIIGTPTTIFARKVEHPGVEATWIIRDSVLENEPLVQQRYKQLLQNRIRQIKNSS